MSILTSTVEDLQQSSAIVLQNMTASNATLGMLGEKFDASDARVEDEATILNNQVWAGAYDQQVTSTRQAPGATTQQASSRTAYQAQSISARDHAHSACMRTLITTAPHTHTLGPPWAPS